MSVDIEFEGEVDLYKAFEEEGVFSGGNLYVGWNGDECGKFKVTDVRGEGIWGITEREWLESGNA